jgi:pimeloyl-ACP methyl ester carboxylesterase
MSGIPMDSSAITAETQYVESRNRKLAYRSLGEGSPLILCNRFRGVMDSWDPAFLDSLALNFRVLIFDYTGLGRSSGAPSFGYMGLAQDAKDLADALGWQRFVIGGWSLGGIVAQLVVTEFPGRVTHGILIATTPPGIVAYAPARLFFDHSLKAENDFDDELVLFFEPASAFSRAAASRSHERIAMRTHDLSPAIPQHLVAGILSNADGPTLFPDVLGTLNKLRSTSVPMLAICGDHDIVFPVENWYSVARHLRTVQLLVYPNCGHGPHHQHPIAVAEYIDTFVRTNE